MPLNFSTARKPIMTFALAGLADIVLLLLIFFLLTSSFVPQFGIRVNLPRVEAGAPTQAQYVTVVLTEDGRFYVEQQQVGREDLLNVLRNVKGERTTLVLRADRRATVEQFAYVASTARALGMTVLMATERPDVSPLR
ncbi:ExbD/TolR family protein [Rhodothermus bifroesti]|jgi:biopolymer transport protein ExbD|uniref:Biopolymer transporter ExbD n=1 Tax=Rhodothermus marinus TaxID=29549 RepID=A0A7V2F7K0_RHOMR|nr:biopolymer transporter ExbD [Rhodothermus bifroesti]GBD02207.1 hypothetical protein HRbin18_01943 [bacterium HR18]